jgi:hypothetical protein
MWRIWIPICGWVLLITAALVSLVQAAMTAPDYNQAPACASVLAWPAADAPCRATLPLQLTRHWIDKSHKNWGYWIDFVIGDGTAHSALVSRTIWKQAEKTNLGTIEVWHGGIMAWQVAGVTEETGANPLSSLRLLERVSVVMGVGLVAVGLAFYALRAFIRWLYPAEDSPAWMPVYADGEV